jgi:hypothetical protein
MQRKKRFLKMRNLTTNYASGAHLIARDNPNWISELLDFHRATFGAAVMEATGDQAPAVEPDTPVTDPEPKGTEDSNEGEDGKLREAGLKALQKERDARKQAETKLLELQKQIEDATKTEAEKQADALKAAQSEAQAAQNKAMKFEVAAELGLDLKLASRLNGNTREELLADGETLREQIGAAPQEKQKKMAPNPALGGGDQSDQSDGIAAGAAAYQKRYNKKGLNNA